MGKSIIKKEGFYYDILDSRLAVTLPRNNRTYGVPRDITEIEEIKSFLVNFTKKLVEKKEKPMVIVRVEDKDNTKTINRVSFRILLVDYEIIIKNVYCGGVWGMDRIFSVLYNFEDLLSRITFGDYNSFDHYSDYSLSNNYKLLSDMFYYIKYEED
ncbi:MAG: hypothetical protein ACTSR2_00125 [Candidatus Hodarchaeales archaeon]